MSNPCTGGSIVQRSTSMPGAFRVGCPVPGSGTQATVNDRRTVGALDVTDYAGCRSSANPVEVRQRRMGGDGRGDQQ